MGGIMTGTADELYNLGIGKAMMKMTFNSRLGSKL
jgi:hypothetical protein